MFYLKTFVYLQKQNSKVMTKINEKVPEKKRGPKKKKEVKQGRTVYLTPTQWNEIDYTMRNSGYTYGDMFYHWYKEAMRAIQLENELENL